LLIYLKRAQGVPCRVADIDALFAGLEDLIRRAAAAE